MEHTIRKEIGIVLHPDNTKPLFDLSPYSTFFKPLLSYASSFDLTPYGLTLPLLSLIPTHSLLVPTGCHLSCIT